MLKCIFIAMLLFFFLLTWHCEMFYLAGLCELLTQTLSPMIAPFVRTSVTSTRGVCVLKEQSTSWDSGSASNVCNTLCCGKTCMQFLKSMSYVKCVMHKFSVMLMLYEFWHDRFWIPLRNSQWDVVNFYGNACKPVGLTISRTLGRTGYKNYSYKLQETLFPVICIWK